MNDTDPAVTPYRQIHDNAVRILGIIEARRATVPASLLDMAIELEHEAERALQSARLAAQVRADLADKRRDRHEEQARDAYDDMAEAREWRTA